MKTIFLSDIHLSEQSPNISEYFNQFIEYCIDSEGRILNQIDSIYLLGDLFEFWIGDDFITPFTQQVFNQLQKLSKSGIKTYFMHGNRDFLAQKEFELMSGFKIIDDPYVITLDNNSIILSHGDIYCTDDIAYQTFRKQVRKPEWQREFLSKTIEERIHTAIKAREESQKRYSENNSDNGRATSEYIEDINEKEIEKAFNDYNANIMIHGHTHRPDKHLYNMDNGDKIRYVLPAWYKRLGFIEYDHNSKEFKYK